MTVVASLPWRRSAGPSCTFAWQGALAGALFAALDLALRGASPRLRYALAAATLAAMALMPPLTSWPRAHDGPGVGALSHAPTGLASSAFGAEVHRPRTDPARPCAADRQRAACDRRPLGAGVLVLSVREVGGWRLVPGWTAPRESPATMSPDASCSWPPHADHTAGAPTGIDAGGGRRSSCSCVRPSCSPSPPCRAQRGQLEALLAHEPRTSAARTIWWASCRARWRTDSLLPAAVCGSRTACAWSAICAATTRRWRRAAAPSNTRAPSPTWPHESAPAWPRPRPAGALFERISRLVRPTAHGAGTSAATAAVLAWVAMAVVGDGLTSLCARPPSPRPCRRARGGVTGGGGLAAADRVCRSPGPEPRGEATGTRPVPIERVIELAIAGVTPEYIDEMAALGYPNRPGIVIAMRSQGVTRSSSAAWPRKASMTSRCPTSSPCAARASPPEYVRDLRAAGYAASASTISSGAQPGRVPDDATEFKGRVTPTSPVPAHRRDAGCIPRIRARVAGARATRPVRSCLIGLRSQGVSVEYVRDLKQLATPRWLRELIELRSQGVSPEFVREAQEAGYAASTTRELIELRAHGVRPELLKRLRTHRRNAVIKNGRERRF